MHGALDEIQAQIAHGESGRFDGVRSAADEGLDPGEQFG
jgi:hypothetical protein